MKCSIIRDLLPLYIDGLTSEESSKEIDQHLDTCDECRQIYENMKTNIDVVQVADDNEINYLKKVKQKFTKRTLIIVSFGLILAAVLAYFYAWGTMINKEDIDYKVSTDDSYVTVDGIQKEGKDVRIDFDLHNGKELLVRTEMIFVTDDSGREYLDHIEVVPYEVLSSPIMEGMATKFTYGYFVGEEELMKDNPVDIIIKFVEEEVVITPKEVYLQEQQDGKL